MDYTKAELDKLLDKREALNKKINRAQTRLGKIIAERREVQERIEAICKHDEVLFHKVIAEEDSWGKWLGTSHKAQCSLCLKWIKSWKYSYEIKDLGEDFVKRLRRHPND